jgi:hypothetical protein
VSARGGGRNLTSQLRRADTVVDNDNIDTHGTGFDPGILTGCSMAMGMGCGSESEMSHLGQRSCTGSSVAASSASEHVSADNDNDGRGGGARDAATGAVGAVR